MNLALDDFRHAKRPELVNSILAIFAMGKGQPSLGRFAIAFTEDERREILSTAGFA
jgi:hypothetical protein